MKKIIQDKVLIQIIIALFFLIIASVAGYQLPRSVGMPLGCYIGSLLFRGKKLDATAVAIFFIMYFCIAPLALYFEYEYKITNFSLYCLLGIIAIYKYIDYKCANDVQGKDMFDE